MQKALQETDSVVLTIEAYMGVMCHHLNYWKMVSRCLTTMPLEERHIATNIAEWIEVIAKFNIPQQKIKALAHDNGANVVAAVKILHEKYGWASVKCAGHTLKRGCAKLWESNWLSPSVWLLQEPLLNTSRRGKWRAKSWGSRRTKWEPRRTYWCKTLHTLEQHLCHVVQAARIEMVNLLNVKNQLGFS